VQCSDGALSTVALDMPSVALTAMAVTTAPAAMTVDHRAWGRSVLDANSTAPHALLQFCRLLN
jgi:hypothetical protein